MDKNYKTYQLEAYNSFDWKTRFIKLKSIRPCFSWMSSQLFNRDLNLSSKKKPRNTKPLLIIFCANKTDTKRQNKMNENSVQVTLDRASRLSINFPSCTRNDTAGNEKETSRALILQRRDVVLMHDKICIKRDSADLAFLPSSPSVLLHENASLFTPLLHTSRERHRPVAYAGYIFPRRL